jgi:phosphohistidine phosphatase
MELILLRHGKAAPHGHPDGDGARELVEKGHVQARQAAKLLAAAGWLPQIVLTSPLARARQTAETFCTAAGLPGPVVQPWLACGMHPELATSELCAFQDFSRVAIVGHEPDFSSLASWLIQARGTAIEVKKGALAAIDFHPPSRNGRLLFLIPPALAACPA